MASKTTSRSSDLRPPCPQTPEVWVHIFSQHSDPAHLWTACRCISSTLRACAEYAFAEYFLPDVHIDFQLEKYNLGGNSKRPEVSVVFDRLGKLDDKELVWFKEKQYTSTERVGKGKQAQLEITPSALGAWSTIRLFRISRLTPKSARYGSNGER
jgi:hypothetical protein